MKRNSFIATVSAAILLTASAISWKPVSSAASSIVAEKAVTAEKTSGAELFNQYITGIYDAAGLGTSDLDFNTFKKAMIGYLNLKRENLISKSMLTIVDFNRPSTQKRMWIVDLDQKKLLFNNLVAHGQGSGDNFANSFSNTEETHQSSLGFYVTSDIYQGKHGLSLKLQGLDKGFNNNALSRSIVLHGAEYVSQSFIDQHGRLGRSFGCPAVPVELTPKIIETVKGKSCIFINGPLSSFNSQYLNEDAVLSDYSGRLSANQQTI